ncbi:hypothetical protein [Marinagarivorans cellulosilyticus]|uniref:Uncharacterized protein n=1 Tax=Marinagarivorans cellulosilyticus TaxID=2721545 RepID=A0AAN1WKY2_9GAMM|nr:hypothetical protein [Marinagarivorans cellulosilyticus]BCD99503.1 hypothetical protein MARGE09_P3705 [Marinagarivorans cellulosilyticus]
MDTQKLKTAAFELEQIFSEISKPSQQLRDLQDSLQPYIESAKNGAIDTPIDEDSIPGNYQMQEGVLSEHPDYEKQYVKFKVALRGGYTQEELEVLDMMKTL